MDILYLEMTVNLPSIRDLLEVQQYTAKLSLFLDTNAVPTTAMVLKLLL